MIKVEADRPVTATASVGKSASFNNVVGVEPDSKIET